MHPVLATQLVSMIIRDAERRAQRPQLRRRRRFRGWTPRLAFAQHRRTVHA